jgi:hypothetical protein
MAPTKDELETENAELRARVAELEQGQGQAVANPVPRPARPDFGLSAGEMDDLKTTGVTVSPFTGELLTATREGVTPENPTAIERDRKETDRLEAAESKHGSPPPDADPATERRERAGAE